MSCALNAPVWWFRVSVSRASATLGLAALLLLTSPGLALAQGGSRTLQDLVTTFDTRMDTLQPDVIRLRLGVGSILSTRLDASASKLYPAVPYVSFTYRDWFALDENEARFNLFSRNSEIGAAGWRAGPMLKVDLGRQPFHSPDLQQMERVDPTLELGGFVSYSLGPARVRIRVRQGVAGGHDGTVAEFDARLGFFKSEHLTLGLQLEANWASTGYMRTFYGVMPWNSSVTGLSAFDPGSSMRNTGISVLGEYKISAHWSVLAAGQYSHLLGQAAASSLTTRLGATNRTSVATFVVYTF